MTNFTSRGRNAMRVLAGGFAAALGLGSAASAPAQTKPIPPSEAPAAWVSYAGGATNAITGWLREESEAGVRLRAYLEATREAPDKPTPPLELRVTVADDGSVSALSFAPFAHEEANADLRGLVVGRKLAGPPPAGMPRTLHILVQLEVRPAEPAAAE